MKKQFWVILVVIVAIVLSFSTSVRTQDKGIRLFRDTSVASYRVRIGQFVMYDSLKYIEDGIPIGVRVSTVDTANGTITYDFLCVKKK